MIDRFQSLTYFVIAVYLAAFTTDPLHGSVAAQEKTDASNVGSDAARNYIDEILGAKQIELVKGWDPKRQIEWFCDALRKNVNGYVVARRTLGHKFDILKAEQRRSFADRHPDYITDLYK